MQRQIDQANEDIWGAQEALNPLLMGVERDLEWLQKYVRDMKGFSEEDRKRSIQVGRELVDQRIALRESEYQAISAAVDVAGRQMQTGITSPGVKENFEDGFRRYLGARMQFAQIADQEFGPSRPPPPRRAT